MFMAMLLSLGDGNVHSTGVVPHCPVVTMSAFPGSDSEIALLAERLKEETRGRYRLLGRHIAGDGYVEFEGLQVAIDRRVTLHVLPRSPLGLSRERATAVMRLHHPHIQSVHEVLELDDVVVTVVSLVEDSTPWWMTRSIDGVSSNDPRWFETV